MHQLFRALVLALVTHCSVAFAASVNINTASHDELVALSGIGPAKAQAIIDYRKAHGPFKSVDDLKNVKGIGAKRLEKLRGEISVGAAPARVASVSGAPKSDGKAAAPPAKAEVRAAEETKARR